MCTHWLGSTTASEQTLGQVLWPEGHKESCRCLRAACCFEQYWYKLVYYGSYIGILCLWHTSTYCTLDDSVCYMTSPITWLRYRKIPFALLYPSSLLDPDSHAQESTAAVVQMLNHSCALSTLFLLGIITFLACPSEEKFCMDFSFFSSHTTYRLNEY